jgi:hypothetical protein
VIQRTGQDTRTTGANSSGDTEDWTGYQNYWSQSAGDTEDWTGYQNYWSQQCR